MNTEARINRLEERVGQLEASSKLVPIRGSSPYADKVIMAVSRVSGVSINLIMSKRRRERDVSCRIACACIMVEDGDMNNLEVGEAINKDPSSISGYKDCFGRIEVREIVEQARRLMEDIVSRGLMKDKI